MDNNITHEYKLYITEIFDMGAHKLFGQLLGLLCEKANISQNNLGKMAMAYRDYLFEKGYLIHGCNTKAVDQSGISRIIAGKRHLSYAQTYIWLKVLRNVFESEEYKNACEEEGRPIFEFTEDLEIDMWRLAYGGTPKEVVEAYERRKNMVKDQRQNDG